MAPSPEVRTSRRKDFFDVIQVMMGPHAGQDLPENTKEQIYHLVEGTAITVSNKEVPNFRLPVEVVNALLSAYGVEARVEEPFMQFFFPMGGAPAGTEPVSKRDLEAGTTLFVKTALWEYGSHERAFRVLGHHQQPAAALSQLPLAELAHEEARKRVLLSRRSPKVERLSFSERESLGYTVTPPGSPSKSNAETRAKATRNSAAYLNSESVEIYLAGSMRKDNFNDFAAVYDRIGSYFQAMYHWAPTVFDPTLSWYPSSFDKGLLESLMLKRASIGLMMAGPSDSFGKDSEVASLLGQGKPVVVLVPREEATSLQEGKPGQTSRLIVFRDVHPLRTQVSPKTGVAQGIIVTDDLEIGVKVIDDLLFHRLQTEVSYDFRAPNDFESAGEGTVTALLELRTSSVVRVVTQNLQLSRTFWNRYGA